MVGELVSVRTTANYGTILVTGGAGFIGSAVIRKIMTTTDSRVINVDSLTYAGNVDSLERFRDDPRHVFEHVDICNLKEVERIFAEHEPGAVLHLAAETHVDRSILGPSKFVMTNVVGTYNMLEAARSYWLNLGGEDKTRFRFHHVSTDEVYGDLSPEDQPFTEQSPYAPSSPYSASKASSDHLVLAWHRTYGLPILVTNCSNNYGPYQFPEKLIPLMILNAIEGRELPIYGDGSNVRDWLFVEDHAEALLCVLSNGAVGRVYNIGGQSERTNLEVVEAICMHLDRLRPDPEGPYRRLIRFVQDRPGHDRRYAIDCRRITQELGWKPKESFETGLQKAVQWYLTNDDWISRVRSGAYRDWIRSNYSRRTVHS